MYRPFRLSIFVLWGGLLMVCLPAHTNLAQASSPKGEQGGILSDRPLHMLAGGGRFQRG